MAERQVVRDDSGAVAAAYCGEPLDEAGRAAMLDLVAAAHRRMEVDDPDGTMGERQAAGLERIRSRVRKLAMSGDDAPVAGKAPRPPESYHTDNHHGPFDGCWRCQRARAICRSKRSFDSYEAADAAVREVNEARGYERALVRYRCRWCPGWHMTTATHKVAVKRAEKQRRKWLRRG